LIQNPVLKQAETLVIVGCASCFTSFPSIFGCPDWFVDPLNVSFPAGSMVLTHLISQSQWKKRKPAILHGKNHGFPQLFPYINPLIGSKRLKIIQNRDLYWRLRLHFVHLVCSPPESCVDTYTCMALDQAKASAMADSIKVELNVLAPGWWISLTCYLWGNLWVVLPCDFGVGSMFQQFLARTDIRMRMKFINVWQKYGKTRDSNKKSRDWRKIRSNIKGTEKTSGGFLN
jgi:hypothetical protein